MSRFSLQQQQSVTLNTRVLTGLKILQLSQSQLAETITELLEKNPLIELVNSKELTTDQKISEALPLSTSSSVSGVKERKYDDQFDYDNQAQSETLQDSLRWQCQVSAESRDIKAAMLIIIDSLSEDGYLRVSEKTLISDYQLRGDVFQKALSAIQLFEPSGIAATSLSECLTIQLSSEHKHHEDQALAKLLINDHLAELADQPHCYSTLAEALGVSQNSIESACNLIRQLNPKPGLSLRSADDNHIRPDIVIRESSQSLKTASANKHFVAEIVNQPSPLRLNQQMIALAKTDKSQQSETNDWIDSKKSEAENILNALDFRKNTLQRVADLIAAEQAIYFEKGLAFLKPFLLTQAAAKLELNPSTLSRTIADKHLTSPQGTEAIRDLFSTALPQQPDLTNRYAKAVLLKIVTKEPLHSPINDENLALAMHQAGIDLSRRAVAKYRLALNIPNSRARRIR